MASGSSITSRSELSPSWCPCTTKTFHSHTSESALADALASSKLEITILTSCLLFLPCSIMMHAFPHVTWTSPIFVPGGTLHRTWYPGFGVITLWTWNSIEDATSFLSISLPEHSQNNMALNWHYVYHVLLVQCLTSDSVRWHYSASLAKRQPPTFDESTCLFHVAKQTLILSPSAFSPECQPGNSVPACDEIPNLVTLFGCKACCRWSWLSLMQEYNHLPPFISIVSFKGFAIAWIHDWNTARACRCMEQFYKKRI